MLPLNLNDVGGFVKSERKKLKITQAELALRSGLAINTIINIEKKGCANLASLSKVLKGLGLVLYHTKSRSKQMGE